jgi:hypothetical protein
VRRLEPVCSLQIVDRRAIDRHGQIVGAIHPSVGLCPLFGLVVPMKRIGFKL